MCMNILDGVLILDSVVVELVDVKDLECFSIFVINSESFWFYIRQLCRKEVASLVSALFCWKASIVLKLTMKISMYPSYAIALT